MGNICRSPTAEGVFRKLINAHGLDAQFVVDSAGTHDYHIGAPPDRRAIAAAAYRAVDISGLRARQVEVEDFAKFDLLLAMDRDNLTLLLQKAPSQYRERARLLLDFAPELPEREVPDPYYGGPEGFERVLDLLETATNGLLQYSQQQK
jgi:protein-tyrosine phosphatase